MKIIKESRGSIVNMAGYNWNRGKSNNACKAEDKGLLNTSDFVKYLKQWKQFKGLTATDLNKSTRIVKPTEWHHSSKFYNCVNYWDKIDILTNYKTELKQLSLRCRQEKWLKTINKGKSFYIYGWNTVKPIACLGINKINGILEEVQCSILIK